MSNTSSSTNTGAAVAPLVPNVPSQQGASSSGSSNLTAEQQQQQLQLQYQQQQLQQQQQSGSSQQGQVTQPGQVQPAPQQHFPHQGLNGGWQSDKDVQERRKMIAKIVHLLQMRKPNAPQEWLKKLPQMAKRLEESLYRSAKSFDEYNDTATLKQRLQQLAVNIGMKTRKMQQAQKQQLQSQQAAFQPQPSQQQQQPPPQQQLIQPSAQVSQPPAPLQPNQPQSAVPSAQASQSAVPRQMVNMADINPIASAASPQQQGSSVPGGNATQAVSSQGQLSQTGSSSVAAPQAAQGASSQAGNTGSGGTRQVSDRQQVLRHQQQRLLLLRHAAKCQHDDQRCPVTPHCAGMKRLWKHIAECKDQKCLVPHCVSSRYVLSHYHRCKDVRCPVCGPVREAIHRSHEKQKQMQALKARHQQALASSGAGAQQAAAIPTADQASKRRKSNSGIAVPSPGYASVQNGTVVRSQNYALAKSGIPHQLPQQVKPGYVYSQSGGAIRPGQPHPSIPGLAYSNGQVIMPKHSGPKPQEDHTLINCFSIPEIETHIQSLNKGLQLSPQQLKTKCLDVLKVLQSHQHGWVFNSPVDPVELGLPDYFEVIKRPMDLGTIKKKLENGCYHSLEEFKENVNLTFDNAMLYNPEGSVVYNMAKEMKAKFKSDYALLIRALEAEEDAKRKNGEACVLCGCEKLLFEPPAFYCNGPNCPSKRIRRNSYYYVGGNNQYHWCHQCFADLKDRQLIELGDITLKKEQLIKKKNDETHEESWVQCDKCERWVHQICSLFNTRQNKDHRSEFMCPRCTIADRKSKGITEGTSSTPMAEDLPRTKLSETLERHVRKKVDEYFDKMARDQAEKENIPLEEAKKKGLHMGGEITIRQVTSMDRKLEVRDRMKRRYGFKNYPEEFTYRCKCIVVFQKLDGVDVVLFGLYVYEHDEKNPAPNTRAVYISYLDSVHYMRPRNLRTLIYHEILISYLDYVRQKGFLTAHIWACPPLKGDDYILYCKPEDQKIPKDDRLRQWYVDMLTVCQKRGICGKVTNMYDLYFADEKNDATVVPYMEGDYFPAEVENIIKDIEEGKHGKKAQQQGKKKKSSSKAKKKSGSRGGTRSSGLDEEALAASGFLPPGMNQKSLEEGGRDFVMAKLGETIHPMKESFLVAFLAAEGADPENLVIPKEFEEERDRYVAKAVEEKKAEEEAEKKAAEEEAAKKAAEEEAAKKAAEEEAAKKAAEEEAKAKAAEGEKEKKPSTSEDATEKKPEHMKDGDAKDGDAKDVEMKDATATSNSDDKAAELGSDPKETPPDTPKADDEATRPEESEREQTADTDVTMADAETSKPEDKASDEAEISENAAEQNKDLAEEESPSKASEVAKGQSEPAKGGSGGTEKSEGDEALPAPDETAAKGDAASKPSGDVEKPAELAESANDDTDSKPDGDAAMAEAKAEGDNAVKPEIASDKPEEVQPESAGDSAKKDESKEVAESTGDLEKKESDAETKGDAEKKDAVGEKKEDEGDKKPAAQAAAVHREGKFAAMAARKRDLDGNIKGEDSSGKKEDEKSSEEKKEEEVPQITVKDSKGRLVKVIDDDLEEMDCEFLNNRQAFLNLCQGNHYQFDQLRRAKHTSMMVLWHLHNRDAPKFVQQCAICSREILSGYRYHCPTCADYDQCQDCVRNPATPRHPHQLKPVPVASGQQSELTAEQRKERQRSIQLHMTLLLHAATCKSSSCPSANCTKMKGLLKHGTQCKIKATGGCPLCKRIWALLQLHARTCKEDVCPVPNCMAIREKFRQLKKQQQAMDDRRRLEMNRHYRGLGR